MSGPRVRCHGGLMVPVKNDESNHADQHDGTPSAREAGLAARREMVVNVLKAAERRDVGPKPGTGSRSSVTTPPT